MSSHKTDGLVPYYYLSSIFLTLVGVWAVRLALTWVTWTTTQSYTWTSAVSTVQLLPTLVVGLFFGALADRVNPARVMIYSETGYGLTLLSLAVFLTVNSLNIYDILVHALLLGMLTAVFMPLHIALLRLIADDARFPRLVTVDIMGFNVATVIGPAISGYALSLFGAKAVFYLGAATFVPLIFVLVSLRNVGCIRRSESSGLLSDIKDLFALVFSTPLLSATLFLVAVCGFFLGGVAQTLPAIAGGLFSRGADDAGLLMTAYGVGAFLATVVLLVVPESSPLKGFSGLSMFLLAACLALLAIAIAPVWSLVAAAAAIIGFGGVGARVVSQVGVQMQAPSGAQGRMAALWTMLLSGGTAVGTLAWGGALDHFAPTQTFFAAALMLGVATVACGGFLYARKSIR